MTNREITKYVADWFARADEDLDIAQLILEEERPYNPACFHEQQAAEKYLKGFLAYYEKHVRKIHDLGALLQECIKIDQSFENLRDSARYLTRFYVESRYPDDYIEFTREDAKKGFEAALRIKEFVLEKIESQKRNGFGIVGIIVVIAAVAVLGGFFGYQYLKLQKMQEQERVETTAVETGTTPPDSKETLIGAYQWKSATYTTALWDRITTPRLKGFLSSSVLIEKRLPESECVRPLKGDYLRFEGGLCRIGYWLEDKSGKKIDSMEKLKARLLPIENEEEAMFFVGVIIPDLKINENDILEGLMLSIDDGFLIQVVRKNTFGCGTHTPTGVIFKVSKDGAIQEIASEIEKKPDPGVPLLCAD